MSIVVQFTRFLNFPVVNGFRVVVAFFLSQFGNTGIVFGFFRHTRAVLTLAFDTFRAPASGQCDRGQHRKGTAC